MTQEHPWQVPLKGATDAFPEKPPFFGGEEPAPAKRYSKGFEDPPTHLVWLTLRLCGYRWWQPFGKCDWAFRLKYKGREYTLYDYRRISWSMRVPDDSPAAKKGLLELHGKIVAACRTVSSHLGKDRDRFIESGEWLLPNNYAPAFNLYRFNADHVPSIKPKEPKPKPTVKGKDAILESIKFDFTKAWDELRDETYYGSSMIVFYFSALEAFMEVAFAMKEPHPMKYKAFRDSDWQTRFKAVFPMSRPDLKKLYDELYRVKWNYRDPLVHGMNGGKTVMVPIKKFGIIPLTLDDHARQRHFGWHPITPDAVKDAHGVFTAFEAWLDAQPFFRMVRRYARTPFLIPMGGERLKELRKNMTSPSKFEAFMEKRVHQWEAHSNWDGRR